MSWMEVCGSCWIKKTDEIKKGFLLETFFVRLTGLEPARRETLDPKSNASTNSATGA